MILMTRREATGQTWQPCDTTYCMPSLTQRPYSVAEVSAKERIPGRTVRYAIDTGALKAQKMPGKTGAWLIQPRDLDRWLATRRGAKS